MPLTINVFGNDNVTPAQLGRAFMINQQWTVRTIGKRRVGTANLNNCMGVVVHSPRYRVGCLAHIEAERIPDPYVEVFGRYLSYMTRIVLKYGERKHLADGREARLQLGLFGNVNHLRDEDFTNALKAAVTTHGDGRFAWDDITDLRNQPVTQSASPAAVYRVGTAVVTNPALPATRNEYGMHVGCRFVCIAYNPQAGSVDVYDVGSIPEAVAAGGYRSGLRMRRLQGPRAWQWRAVGLMDSEDEAPNSLGSPPSPPP